jgi:acetyltransferase-like isoleucine patch superfamily enzyme
MSDGADRTARLARSHGTGQYDLAEFKHLGAGVVIEPGVLVFHPENIELGDGVYVGHYTILKGYHNNRMVIGPGTWIGQQCFLHGAGGIVIGANVGIGPGVKVLTSFHGEDGRTVPIVHSRIETAAVEILSDSDIGVGAILLPGVTIGRGAQIGAGAIVSRSVPDYAVAAGVPARVLRYRDATAGPPGREV